MRRKKICSGLTVATLVVAVLITTHANATSVSLSMSSNNIIQYQNASSTKDVAQIAGCSGDLVNGVYEGGGMALTSVAASSAFYGSEAAGTKITWTTRLKAASVNPVNLYLDLNSWVTTDGFILALGSISHGIYAEFAIWEQMTNIFGIKYFFPTHTEVVRLGSTDDIKTTFSMGQVTEAFILAARFEVASSLTFGGPGVASASAFGYLDFKLRADDPTLPIPTPEPTTALLLGCGLIGLAGAGRRIKSF